MNTKQNEHKIQKAVVLFSASWGYLFTWIEKRAVHNVLILYTPCVIKTAHRFLLIDGTLACFPALLPVKKLIS